MFGFARFGDDLDTAARFSFHSGTDSRIVELDCRWFANLGQLIAELERCLDELLAGLSYGPDWYLAHNSRCIVPVESLGGEGGQLRRPPAGFWLMSSASVGVQNGQEFEVRFPDRGQVYCGLLADNQSLLEVVSTDTKVRMGLQATVLSEGDVGAASHALSDHTLAYCFDSGPREYSGKVLDLRGSVGSSLASRLWPPLETCSVGQVVVLADRESVCIGDEELLSEAAGFGNPGSSITSVGVLAPTEPLRPSDRIYRSPGVFQLSIDGSLVVVSQTHRHLAILDPLMAVLWESLDGVTTVRDLKEDFSGAIDPAGAEPTLFVEEFLDSLLRTGLVRRASDQTTEVLPAPMEFCFEGGSDHRSDQYPADQKAVLHAPLVTTQNSAFVIDRAFEQLLGGPIGAALRELGYQVLSQRPLLLRPDGKICCISDSGEVEAFSLTGAVVPMAPNRCARLARMLQLANDWGPSALCAIASAFSDRFAIEFDDQVTPDEFIHRIVVHRAPNATIAPSELRPSEAGTAIELEAREGIVFAESVDTSPAVFPRILRVRAFSEASQAEESQVRKAVVSQWMSLPNPFNSNQFLLEDPTGYFSRLYARFLEVCQLTLGPFDVSSANRSAVWAYVSCSDSRRSTIHSHAATADINGVFYFSLPRTTGRGGTSLFSDEGIQLDIEPEENDLLIFSGLVRHRAQRSELLEPRIVINMELLVDEPRSMATKLRAAEPGSRLRSSLS